MEIQTAMNLVNGDPVSGDGPAFVYKPGYTFHADDYTYRMQGAILLTISMVTQSTDREDARRGFNKMLEPLHTTFPIIVKDCKSDDDFLYEVLKVVIELETHEAREFLRKTGTYSAPFHPHRHDSMERYSRYSGRHVSDDLNYGAFAPIPRSRLVDQNAQHVEKAHHGPEHTDTAPRTVDNDGPAASVPAQHRAANGSPMTVDS
jgi:hypothetical protein